MMNSNILMLAISHATTGSVMKTTTLCGEFFFFTFLNRASQELFTFLIYVHSQAICHQLIVTSFHIAPGQCLASIFSHKTPLKSFAMAM